ncbi:MAG: HNH endonuclease [Bacteroidota bacterium]|nr:HNH endonuclease [Bacteroidota bacterium]
MFEKRSIVFEDAGCHTASRLSGRVLILNQSYEPITVCNVQKAVILVYLEKAEIVATADGKVIRSPSTAFPFPSVIRLTQYKRVPYRRIILSRKNILRRDNHCCQYCGTTAAPITVDHVIPRSQGGTDTWENLVAACIRCNNLKGDRTPEKAGMRLRSIPRRPSHVSFIIHSAGTVDEAWRPYLFIE